jgi:hypothetical protein
LPTISTSPQTNFLAPNWTTGNYTLQQVDQQLQQQGANTGYLTPCPLSTPFYNGAQCIACGDQSPYFNLQTNTCTSCMNYDPKTHTCGPSGNYNLTNFETALNRVVLPFGISAQSLLNQPGIQCPASMPFLSAGTCIDCFSPTPLFNYSTSLCTTCAVGLTFVAERNQCVNPNEVYVTNLPAASGQLILPPGTTMTDLQNQQNSLSASKTVVPCPASTPFFNSINCISCPLGLLFSVQSLMCQACPNQTVYNTTTSTCTYTVYYSNLNNRNWTSTNPEAIRQNTNSASTTPGAVPCPDATPFFSGTVCIGCPTGQQFSFDGMKCETCATGTLFDSNEHSCVVP